MYASISLHLSVDMISPLSESKKLHGDYASSKEDATEPASSATLTYLKKRR